MLTTNEIHVRDPFVLVDNGVYYLYGSRGWETWGLCTGIDVYCSTDLEHWEGPIEVFTPPKDFWSNMHFWAPEVHAYEGAYYLFISFKSESRHRGTQILRAESPMGPFLPISEGPVTPEDWECLDGTLYVDEKGDPYMIFCHEWTQVGNGEMCLMPLSRDLTRRMGEPKVLFRAGDLPWIKSLTEGKEDYCTDGPFLYTTKDGVLLMLWSSYSESGYTVAQATAVDGHVNGRWVHADALVSDCDGGHGMLFRTFDGALTFVMHKPNVPGQERPCFVPATDIGDGIRLG